MRLSKNIFFISVLGCTCLYAANNIDIEALMEGGRRAAEQAEARGRRMAQDPKHHLFWGLNPIYVNLEDLQRDYNRAGKPLSVQTKNQMRHRLADLERKYRALGPVSRDRLPPDAEPDDVRDLLGMARTFNHLRQELGN